MRDMTDTMYDPSKWPYVNHFTGTHLIVEHIEKYICPSITSVAFLGGEAFRFGRDRRKVVMLIGDDEYKTEVSLPAFVKSDLEPLGFDVTIIHADSQDKHNFPGMAEAIKQADLVLVSVRRRMPPKAQLDALRAHFAAGKPIVGIRTACHAWQVRNEKELQAAMGKGLSQWPEFDPEVFGGHYVGHHGSNVKTAITLADSAKDHPILRGIEAGKLVGNGSLYRVLPLAATTTPLLIGTVPDKEAEPVAWTNIAGPKNARIFNTTLGHEGDFANPVFRKLLANALFWALDEPYPVGQDIEKLLPAAVK
jgi:type 1 glutamine amidotransferase